MAQFTETEKQVRKMIMDQVIATGTCPPVAEIAEAHSLSKHELDTVLRDLEAGICVALQNETHEGITHFQGEKLEVPAPALGEIFYARPFATFKNHYPIWVDGQQKWYGECAVEACGVSGIFPGKEVVVRSRCRQTREPVEIITRDGKLIEYSPKTLRVHLGFPFRYLPDDIVGWCDFNSFFASEEAVDEWRKTNPTIKGTTKSVESMMNFVVEIAGRGRLDYDYMFTVPLLKALFQPGRYGLIKKWLGIPIFDPFWFPTLHTALEMRRKGYKFYLKLALF